MTLHAIVLFLHVLGALGAFAALGIEWAGAGAARAPRRIAGLSAGLILLSGMYLGATGWGRQAWIGLGFLGLVLMAILGAALRGRPAVSLRLRTAVATGVVFLMTGKPGTGHAVAVMSIAVALGVAWAAPALGRRRAMDVELAP